MKRLSAATLALAMLISAIASIQLFASGSANPSSIIPPPPPLPRICVRPDGSIDPASSPVQRAANIYTLTASLTEHVIEVQCDNVVIEGGGYTITGKTYENGIVLSNRRNVIVKNFVLKTFNGGIYLWNSTGCTVEGNTVTNSTNGIIIATQAKNNVIRGNIFNDNSVGIYVSYSGNNQFRNNVMRYNKDNLHFELGNAATPQVSLQDLNNDIDFSNTADGKPVCYWMNRENEIVPSDCACVVLIHCRGIIVQSLNLSKNGCGVLLFATNDSIISQNNVTGNGYGVWADRTSTRITIENNEVTRNSDDGISLVGSNHNKIADNTVNDNNKLGIRLENSEGCSIVRNTIRANFYGGIGLRNVSQTQISDNQITDHEGNQGSAISLGLTLNSTISGNALENNLVGLFIHDLSKGNTLSGNSISNNAYGIWFYYTTSYGLYLYPTSSNTFRNNSLNNNEHCLKFESSYVQDIDPSNTANGKSIYYWVNQTGECIPYDAGYIALVNCTAIIVANVSITDSMDGIMLFGTTNSLITRSSFNSNNEHGVYICHSTNNTISENQIFSNTWDGIFSEDSFNNTFSQNHVSNNLRVGIELISTNGSSIVRNNVTANHDAGIKLNDAKNNCILENYVSHNNPGILLIWGTSQCRVVANTMTQNENWGLRIDGAKIDSIIHHNNFIDNKVNQSLQVSIPWPADPNTWNDSTEGNYWSDYAARYPNASEVGETGVGDTPFFINENNVDQFPLLKPVGLPNSSASPQPFLPSSDGNSSTPRQDNPDQADPDVPNVQILTAAAATTCVTALAGSILLFWHRKTKPKYPH